MIKGGGSCLTRGDIQINLGYSLVQHPLLHIKVCYLETQRLQSHLAIVGDANTLA